MRLATFICENPEHIIREWENFARTLTPASDTMSSLALRDHIQQILDFICDDMESAQTGSEQIIKSHGQKAKTSVDTAAETHAALRYDAGFDIDQMVSEYRALRASVIKLWTTKKKDLNGQDILDLTRFHEAIDQQLSESVAQYTEKVHDSKELFLGVLSHDLRTPLSAALMSSELILKIGKLDERQTMLSLQSVDSITRASQIVTNLFDIMRARLGSGLPAIRQSMNMGFIGRQVVEEMQAVHPNRVITVKTSGKLDGEWDKARIGQVFSNLINNAVQYGSAEMPIEVDVKGEAQEIIVSVHNSGEPIPASTVGRIFDSFSRGFHEGVGKEAGPMHLGLGLYITKEIVTSHGGTISVTSSKKDGTTFTAHMPRLVQ